MRFIVCLLFFAGLRAEEPAFLSNKMASLVQEEIKGDKFFHRSFLKAYLEGARAAEENRQIQKIESNDLDELYQIEKELTRAKNFQKAEAYLSKKRSLIEVVPKKLYYKELKKKEGSVLTKNSTKISLHYSFQILNGKERDFGTIKKEGLADMIPGIAHAILGMRKDEIREIYMHPEYASGKEEIFQKDALIIAKVELLDFLESPSESSFQEPRQIVKGDPLQLLKRYQALKKRELFENAREFWSFLKARGAPLDFASFAKELVRDQPLLSKEEKAEFIEKYIEV